MDPNDQEYIERSIDAAMRCYLMLLLHRFAPEGASFSNQEAKAIMAAQRHHLMVYQIGDVVTLKLLTTEERDLILSPPAGSC